MSLFDWVAARALDAKLAGDTIPGWMALVGLLLFGLGAAVLAALVVRARDRRLDERERPEPPSLLDVEPWLAPRMRQPSPHAQRGGVYHGRPVEDPEETATLFLSHGDRGGRRG